jgi:hypothetical protein
MEASEQRVFSGKVGIFDFSGLAPMHKSEG